MNNIEKIAMNIVYQLDDDSNLSVEFRQVNNDKRIDFVKSILASHRTAILQDLLDNGVGDKEQLLTLTDVRAWNKANQEWREIIKSKM